jgi:hypothetical protein
MSTPNPIEVAAIPSAVAILQAVQAFMNNLGTDPLQAGVKLPGALQIFIGTVEMQAPTLASSEFGALQTTLNSKIAAWITKLQAK